MEFLELENPVHMILADKNSVIKRWHWRVRIEHSCSIREWACVRSWSDRIEWSKKGQGQ
jgi:hypothetical protein